MAICLKRGADLHITQLMPLPLTVSCFSKIQIGFTFLVPAHLGSPGKRAVKRVCVCARCTLNELLTDPYHIKMKTLGLAVLEIYFGNQSSKWRHDTVKDVCYPQVGNCYALWLHLQPI